MNLRKAENYNIGLDIGTGSVGWAVSDSEGELYHFKKKPTWGSRLFPSAQTAADTRFHRGQRRRYARRRQRLDWLQEFFCEEISKVDPEFFIRLRQSRLWKEDRAEGHSDYRWPFFNDSDFTERDYYEKFPTIYHLRKWLMEVEEKADIRLIYLAFHNIVKTRGNFLHQDNPSLSAKNASMKDSVEQLCSALIEWGFNHDIECQPKPKRIAAVFENPSTKRAEKRDEVQSLLGLPAEHKAVAKELAGAVLGYKANYEKVFEAEGEGLKFELGNDEAVEAFLSGPCPDDAFQLFEALQSVYSSFILLGILKGANGQTISYCKVNEYEQYGKDLQLLKDLVREYAPDQYNEFFRGPHYKEPQWSKDYDPSKAKGYTRYNLGVSKSSYDSFKKETMKLFAGTAAEDDLRFVEMKEAFEEERFLRRLKTSDNGSIPYQLHLEEMTAIIDRQSAYYPFLKVEADKIKSLVSFRIPYYVGPLTTKNAALNPRTNETRFAWSARKPGMENAPVHPWDWEQAIDRKESAERFIRRMTGTCTYLNSEPVLPKCSLLYEKYCVLNELNGARWSQDGDDYHRFCASDRFDIYEQLFKQGSVSYKKVENWLEQNGRLHPHVRGGQGETKFESKLSSHLFFCKVLEVDDLGDSDSLMAEELILWNTLFEDRGILKEKIEAKYGERLTARQIKQICKKRFTGWGRLSKKFLCELKAKTAEGPRSIMDLLIEGEPQGKHIGSAMVLMEILHDDKLGFMNLVDEFNLQQAKSSGGLSIEDLKGSPALRRGVNQAVRIVEEIVSIAGKRPPANIFVEVTRDEDVRRKGQRTKRRYDGLKEALENLKSEGREVLGELKARDHGELDERLSLYFMQNGKCLYCGKHLEIEHVMNGDQAYQVDHIIPQSYIKDDSFDNKALVHSGCNQRKLDDLLLDESIRRKMADLWSQLHDARLISDKKHNNLMRSYISENQMKGFINRQLVETSQIVKYVQMMLRDKCPETDIVPIKASLSHMLRESQGFVKCREANNYHHAHDAYLASEIGRFLKFRHGNTFDNPLVATKVMRAYIRSVGEQYKRKRRMPGSASYFIGSFLQSGLDLETGEVFRDSWNAEEELWRIRRFLNYKDCYISRMPEVTTGAFWDATIYSPKDPSKKLALPLKKGLDPKRYGSYSNNQYAYFFIFMAENQKGKERVFLEGVPITLVADVDNDDAALINYANTILPAGFSNVRILKNKIYKYQVVEYGGDRFFMGAVDAVYSARDIVLSEHGQASLFEVEEAQKNSPFVQVDEEKMLALYDEVTDRIASICSRYAGIQTILHDNRSRFVAATNYEKQALLLGLLRLIRIQSGKTRVDLKAVGGSPNAGAIKNGFLRNDLPNVVFIDESVTGMFERRQCIGI